MQRNSFAQGSSGSRHLWFLIRALIVILVTLCLAGIHFRTKIRQNQILFLLDVSDSILPEQREEGIQRLNESIRRINSPDQVGVIAFGANAEVERFPSRPYLIQNIETPVDKTATNFEQAARLAEALFAPNYQKNVVVISDGLENVGKADEMFALLRKKGISTQAFYLKPTAHPEAGIEEVRFPQELSLKETFPLDIIPFTNRRMQGLLQVFRNGELHQEGAVSLDPARKQLIRIRQRITTPGIYRYEVKLKPERDFRNENNIREAWVSVQGPARILLVDEKPEDLIPLSNSLRKRGFEVDLKHVENFPVSLQEMLLYQAIFIRNIPASRIHDQMPNLQRYVEDFGGGFAMLGGEKSFGPGGYYRTPVESVLPVRMDLVNKKYLVDIAMVIVIDKSGSMSFTDRGRQKIDLADEGGARVASMLKSSDQLGVLAVDSVPKWAFSLQRLSKPEEAVDATTSIRAGGGGIYVYSGLKEAYRELKGAKAVVKHVILFADTADCEEKDGPQGDSSLALAQRALGEDKISTTTIGIGQNGDVDVEFLRQLATVGEGRFYFTNDMYTLPEIFTQESALVQRYYINEERFTPRMLELDPLLAGIDSVPDLLGYVATTPKGSARTALLSQREDPVLAFWRHGLGQTVAFTSDPTSGWGEPWLGWSEYERFWAQITRYLARATQPPGFRTSFADGGDHTTIIVEALGEQESFLNDADFRGVFMDPSGQAHSLRFLQTAPGRYEAELRASGSLFGKIFRIEDGNVQEESIVQHVVAGNREWNPYPGDGRKRLQQLTGTVVDSPDQLRFSEKSSEEIHPLQDRLLLWIAILFLFDAAARKIELRHLKLPARKMAAEPVFVSPLAQLKGRKKTIQEQQALTATDNLFPDSINFDSEPVETPIVAPEVAEVHPTSRAEPDQYMQRLKDAKKRRN